MGFYHRLTCGPGNQLWQAESLALGIAAEDSVLCVAAGGDRPLHVLLDNPRRVLAIGSNRRQIDRLERKIRAIRRLSHRQYLARLALVCQRSLFCEGRVLRGPLPSYLQPTSYDYIRERIGRIEIVTADVASHLQSNNDFFDVFSLSDIASGMTCAGFCETLHSVRERANAGARFCIRDGKSVCGIPACVAPYFLRDTEREQLAQACRADVPDAFLAGRILTRSATRISCVGVRSPAGD